MENVIITGATGGLGCFMVDEFLRDGCNVFALDIKPEKDSSGHEDRTKGTYHFFRTDIGSDESVKDTMNEIGKMVDSIDLLVNCCGILPPNSANVLEDFDIDSSIDVYNINCLGPLRAAKFALPLLKKGDGKIIADISSEAGSLTTHADYTFRYDYCASKCALNIQSIILQRYLKDEGFKVLLFHPGWMRTQMGGAEAPILPCESAKQLHLRIREQQKNDAYEICLMDYDGKIRAW